MSTKDGALARRAAGQHGVVTAAQAAALGLTPRQVQLRVEDGTLVRLHRGVYRHAGAPETPATDTMAAVLGCGSGAVASHRSAGRAWCLRGVPRWRPEVTVPGTSCPVIHGVVIHRTDTLEAPDVARQGNVPVTSVARTLLDLGGLLPPPVLATTAEDAAIRGLVSPLDLVCILERLGGPGRRGAAALRTVVRGLAPPPALESRLEQDLLRLVRASGAPAPVVQHEVKLPGGLRVRFDLAWPERQIAVEADGRRWHATAADFQRDLIRHNAVTAAGWRLFRYGWADVHQRRAETLAELTGLLARTSAA